MGELTKKQTSGMWDHAMPGLKISKVSMLYGDPEAYQVGMAKILATWKRGHPLAVKYQQKTKRQIWSKTVSTTIHSKFPFAKEQKYKCQQIHMR